MKIVKIGVIVEVSISNKEYNNYKTESGRDNFICRKLDDFISSLQDVNGMKIVYSESSNYKTTEINEFNYSCHNQVQQNKDYHVYRSFGNSLYAEVSEDDTDMLDKFGDYCFRNKKREFLIKVSSLGSRPEQTKKIEYLGRYERQNN